MTEKILVRVRLPVAELERDVLIPTISMVGDLNKALARLFAEMSGGCFTASDDTGLWDAVTGQPLDAGKTIEELGVGSGAMLLII